MNKKRIGALLIGATLLVGALGSFAYFNGKSSTIGGSDNNQLQKLTITNGNVVVSSEVTNNGTDNLDWSYDVVEHSLEGIERTEEFINANRTPDIEGAKKSEVNGIERVDIGAALPTEINFTRPGDAIVLGVKDATTGETGLVVTNNSNLTVKMQLVVKTDENAKAMIKAMNDAGWIMYVDGEEATLESGNIVDLGVVAPGVNSAKVSDIRFELPLLRDNNYQNATNVNEALAQGLDLSQIIEIQATQENNTGWNEDGTGDRIVK